MSQATCAAGHIPETCCSFRKARSSLGSSLELELGGHPHLQGTTTKVGAGEKTL